MGQSQNIYDNKDFFKQYKALREQTYNYNVLQEQPAIKSLLPDLSGKTILDLGCGFGQSCKYFIEMGAKKVVGIDLSHNMLEIAQKENNLEGITYKKMDIQDIHLLEETFDVVYSSLAFHYIEDFKELIHKIYCLLKTNGILIYSQEHPLTTAYMGETRWTKDFEGNYIHYNLANYMNLGRREDTWLVEGVIKYHRHFSYIINTLAEEKFEINRLLEPVPSEDDIKHIPRMIKDFHKPNFLIIRAQKK